MGNFQSTKKCFLTINSHTPAVKSIKLLNRNFSVAIVLEIKNNSHTLKSHLKKFYLIEPELALAFSITNILNLLLSDIQKAERKSAAHSLAT